MVVKSADSSDCDSASDKGLARPTCEPIQDGCEGEDVCTKGLTRPTCESPLEVQFLTVPENPGDNISLSSCCAAEITPTVDMVFDASITNERLDEYANLDRWLDNSIMQEQLNNDVRSAAAPEELHVNAVPTVTPVNIGRAERLNAKTSPALAEAMGHSDAYNELEVPSAPEPTKGIPFTHGGYLLRTGKILWCVKCGASATIGKVSRYLRKPCNGKVLNKSMKQRRSRLVRGLNPNNCAPLVGKATRVLIGKT